mmetsp:Transcript_66798/g.186387  ORF Transcript_66798/g.186387 Transcript_66798/m.186387 type:complete len:359 (-) Transcript_66798:2437-3513(-)
MDRPHPAEHADVTLQLLDNVVELAPGGIGLRELLLQGLRIGLLLRHRAPEDPLLGLVHLHLMRELVHGHLEVGDRLHLLLVPRAVVLLIAPEFNPKFGLLLREHPRALLFGFEFCLHHSEFVPRIMQRCGRRLEGLLPIVQRRLALGGCVRHLVALGLGMLQSTLQLRPQTFARRELAAHGFQFLGRIPRALFQRVVIELQRAQLRLQALRTRTFALQLLVVVVVHLLDGMKMLAHFVVFLAYDSFPREKLAAQFLDFGIPLFECRLLGAKAVLQRLYFSALTLQGAAGVVDAVVQRLGLGLVPVEQYLRLGVNPLEHRLLLGELLLRRQQIGVALAQHVVFLVQPALLLVQARVPLP